MSKLIYIVDDEKEICELLRIVLESRNYEVQVGYDGEDALMMIEKKKPDLLIIDMMMPRKNGYEVIARLKNIPETAQIPIMVLTSLTKGSRKSDEEWKKSLAVQDFITKPFEPLGILKRVQEIVGQ
jgi:CheY-like chemotaxis protein